jgi:alanyl aminopeptidase
MVFTVPAGMLPVTNTPEVARWEHDGEVTVTFAPSEPMPSYLIAIAVGTFEGTEMKGLGVPGRVLAPAGMGPLTAKAAEVTPGILHALEDYFGRPYPYAKLDLIAVPEFWPGAMENIGLVTFADNILLLDPAGASTGQLRNNIRVTAHELAHMWFGDLVTMEWWDDLWLNESFADWMANKVTDELYPQFEIDLFSRRGIQGILGVDARPTTEAIRQPISRPEEAMSNVGLAYAKGRAVLGMVESWLGEDTFRRGVVAYVNRHAGGNAVGADLWQALSEASGQDVAGVLEGFLDQPGYPLLSVETFGKDGVRIAQQRFLNEGVEAPALTWKVPVSLKWSDGLNVHTHDLLLTEASTSFHLPGPVAWVMPDAGADGYYRWQVPDSMLRNLAEHSAEDLTPAERIAFLGNAAALLDAGRLGGDGYLGVLNAFANDPQPDVVAAVVGSLAKVQGAFVPDDLRDAFAVYVRRTLRPALERWGMEPQEGEAEAVTLFRPQLLGWLGDEGEDPEVLAFAEKTARAYLADPSSVAPSLAGTVLGLAAKHGDAALWERYREGFENAATPVDRNRFLGSLGDFEDPALQEKALDYALSGPLRPTEMFNIPGSVAGSPGGDDRTYDWFIAHYDVIADSLPPDFRPFLVGIAGGCSAERLASATEFFSDESRQVPGTLVQLAKVTAQVNDCVSLRQREGAAVASYLRSLGGGSDGSDSTAD